MRRSSLKPAKQKAQHVPYRNSKLTHLLQDSLSGDSKVLMIVTASPGASSVTESISSLNFASRCRATALGKATRQGSSFSPSRVPKSSSSKVVGGEEAGKENTGNHASALSVCGW